MTENPRVTLKVKPNEVVHAPKPERQWVDAPEPIDRYTQRRRRAWWRNVARRVFLKG